jgi:hypothetical protein
MGTERGAFDGSAISSFFFLLLLISTFVNRFRVRRPKSPRGTRAGLPRKHVLSSSEMNLLGGSLSLSDEI